MATIKDIAKKAKVAISTVSYALNDDPRISKETTQRVLEVARELNYVANGGARSLRTNKSNKILVMVANFIGPIYNVILETLSSELNHYGYQLFVCSGNSAQKILLEKNYDGLINFDANVPLDILIGAADFGFPIIDMTREIEKNNLHGCVIENFKPIYEIVIKAHAEGYRKIAYMRGSTISYDERERYNGFIKAMSDVGLEPFTILKGDFTSESGYDAMKKYCFDNLSNLPDLLICANDEMAIGCYDFLKKKNPDLIEKMRLIGFDNIQLTKYYLPPISSVDVSRVEWVKHVVKMLIAYLNNKPIEKKVLPYHIIRRDSF